MSPENAGAILWSLAKLSGAVTLPFATSRVSPLRDSSTHWAANLQATVPGFFTLGVYKRGVQTGASTSARQVCQGMGLRALFIQANLTTF